MQFKPGDLVRLRSGGPVMTVEFVNQNDDDVVRCLWFDGGEVLRDAFDSVSLAIESLVEFRPKDEPRIIRQDVDWIVTRFAEMEKRLASLEQRAAGGQQLGQHATLSGYSGVGIYR